MIDRYEVKKINYLHIQKNKILLSALMILVGSAYVLMGPNGVDWKYYSTVSPRYDEFYFYREFFSWFIIDIINSADASGKLMAFLMSTSLFYVTVKFSKDLSHNLWISLLTAILLAFSNFYLLMSVNGIRQGISLILIILSLCLWNKGKLISLTIFILAVFSHNSAVLFLPLLFARDINSVIFVLGCLSLIMLGDAIINIASKNSNPSPTLNKSLFMYVSVVLLALGAVHKILRKHDKGLLRSDSYVFLSQMYLFALGAGFYGSSAVYERLVYTIIPLMIIYANYWLRFYRPKIVFFLL